MSQDLNTVFARARILTVGGGKGGVGKSIISAGIAGELARTNKQVIVIDADLSGANLHLNMGIRYPEKNLNDFISGSVKTLEEVLIDTPVPNVKLISGASGIYDLINIKFLQKQKMTRSFLKLSADYIIIDVGAGADIHNTDFYSLSEHGIVVVTNEPTSIENAYSFLKNSIIRKMIRLFAGNKELKQLVSRLANPRKEGFVRIPDIITKISEISPENGKKADEMHRRFKPRLIVNMVKNQADLNVEGNFRNIVKKYLNIDIVYIGYLVYDEGVEQSIRQIKPVTFLNDSRAVACLKSITQNILFLEENRNGISR